MAAVAMSRVRNPQAPILGKNFIKMVGPIFWCGLMNFYLNMNIYYYSYHYFPTEKKEFNPYKDLERNLKMVTYFIFVPVFFLFSFNK